jgi:multidrug resistance efflux pump
MTDTVPKKEKSLTVFRSDRHEDMASIVTCALVVIAVLVYMAFLTGPISLKAPSDGKILGIAVKDHTSVKKGDLLLTMEVKEKKVTHGKMEEKVLQKEIKSKMNGTVLSVSAATGNSVAKDKDLIMVIKPQKGTLP